MPALGAERVQGEGCRCQRDRRSVFGGEPLLLSPRQVRFALARLDIAEFRA